MMVNIRDNKMNKYKDISISYNQVIQFPDLGRHHHNTL